MSTSLHPFVIAILDRMQRDLDATPDEQIYVDRSDLEVLLATARDRGRISASVEAKVRDAGYRVVKEDCGFGWTGFWNLLDPDGSPVNVGGFGASSPSQRDCYGEALRRIEWDELAAAGLTAGREAIAAIQEAEA